MNMEWMNFDIVIYDYIYASLITAAIELATKNITGSIALNCLVAIVYIVNGLDDRVACTSIV